MDVPTVARPTTLPTSLSEPATSSSTQKRITCKSPATPAADDSSSPDSNDSSSLNGDAGKKKKKRKLLGKLLKGHGDKHKTS